MASMDDRPNLVKLTQQVKAQPFPVAVELLWGYAELAYRFGYEDGEKACKAKTNSSG